MIASQPWAVPGPPGRALRETCKQPKLWDFSPASWQLPVCIGVLLDCSVASKKPTSAKGLSWAHHRSRARGVALRRQLQGCLSKPAQRNNFWGEILALQLSSMTPAGARDSEEDAYRTDTGRELSLGFQHSAFALFYWIYFIHLMVYKENLSKRRGVSKEHYKGDGCVWEPSDARGSSPAFLHVSDTILIRGTCLPPPASNWSWRSYDTSQGRNSDQTHLKHKSNYYWLHIKRNATIRVILFIFKLRSSKFPVLIQKCWWIKMIKSFFCKTFICYWQPDIGTYLNQGILFCAFSFIFEPKWRVPGNKQGRQNRRAPFHNIPRISVLFGDSMGASLHEKRCLSLKIYIRKTIKECVCERYLFFSNKPELFTKYFVPNREF